MPEINLLPDDLRSKEKKELEAVHKRPKVFNVTMSTPKVGKIDQPLKTSNPSLLSRLFAKKVEKPNMTLEKPEAKASSSDFESKSRETKIRFEMPKMSLKDNEPAAGFDNVSAGVGSNNKDSEIEERPKGASFNTTEEVKFKPVGGTQAVAKEIISSKQTVLENDNNKTPKPKGKSKGWFKFSFGKKDKKDKDLVEPSAVESLDALKTSVNSDAEKVEIKSKKHKDKKAKRRESGSLDVNLIPDELSRHPELELPKKLTASAILIFLVILLIFGAYLGITWYQLNLTKQIGQFESEIASLDRQIESAQSNKDNAVELQQKLKTLKELLNNHVYWTKFFSMLEKYTITDVYFTNFAMTGQDKLVLSAVGKDYQSVAKQLVAFQEATDFVRSVRIDSASSGIDFETGKNSGVSFNINLEFQAGVFLKPVD